MLEATAREPRAVAAPSSHATAARHAVVALARIEARKIVTHPAFVAAMLLVSVFGFVTVGGRGSSIRPAFLAIGVGVGVAVGGLLSANLAAQRSRRDHTSELYDSLPSPPEARTAAVLLGSLAGPVLIASVIAGAGVALLRSDEDLGAYMDLTLGAQFPLMVAALCAIGIGTARWLPGPMTAPVILVAQVMTPILWAAPWITVAETGARMPWHFAYVVAVIALWSALALLRDRRTPARWAAAGIGLAVAIAGVALQLPPEA
jgi:hypothetical protein